MSRDHPSEGAGPVHRLDWTSLRLLGIRGRVRPDERLEVGAAFLTLFGFMTGHALLETARDALFLARLPARQLPWVYLAIAVLALAAGQREPRVVRRLSGGNELARWLLAASGVTLAFWSVASRPWPWVYYGLYVWSGVLATLVVIRFWTVLGSRFTLTQAKRLFPLVAAGSVAGAIAGSGAARALTAVLPASSLVLAAGLVFLVTARAPAALGGDASPRAPAAEPDDLPRVARMIWKESYLRRVAALVLLATVTFTLVDFVFKSSADHFVAPDQLGAFFSSVYLTLNVLSLAVQLVGVTWLLRHAGLVATTAVVPAALVVATLGFTVGGGLGMALLLKGADGSLRHSVYRTSTELLFVPLSERLRTRVKGFIDVLGQRGGQALASVMILMILSTASQERIFAALACLTAVGWLVVALGLKDSYLNLFRQTLHEDGRTDVPARDFPALDVASLETLLTTLNAPDEERVVAALGVLEDQGKEAVVPSLLLYHPSPRVVVRTLEVFQAGGREDALPMARRLLAHADPEVRLAALRTLSALRPERVLLEEVVAGGEPPLALTAEVALLACGWSEPDVAARSILTRLEAEPGLLATAAAAVRTHALGPVEPVILALLRAADPEVVRGAVEAAARLRSPALLDPLMQLLPRRAVREETRSALAAFGPVGMARMAECMADRAVPLAIRRHLPGAIALVGSPQAPELLLRHLRDEPDGLVRFKILRALGRWRNEQPHLPLDLRLLADALEQALSTGYRLMGWRRALERGAARRPERATELRAVLVALLRDKEDHALERVFRLLNLQSGSEEFQRVYRGLHSPRATTRAGSRELLGHLVVPAVRHTLLRLVDDLHGDAEPTDARSRDEAGDEEVLAALLASGMESVSALAAAHAAELRLGDLAPALAECTPLSEEHGGTLARARAALETEVP